MASARNKQEELRRLMREKIAGKSTTTSLAFEPQQSHTMNYSTSNIPFVKVTSSGKRICTLCPGVLIKSLTTHQFSAEHKRNFKAHKAALTSTLNMPKLEQRERSIETKHVLPKKPPRSILKNPLVRAPPPQEPEHRGPETKQPHAEVHIQANVSTSKVALKAAEPFRVTTVLVNPNLKRSAEDSDNSTRTSIAESEKIQGGSVSIQSEEACVSSMLPEGFFDDPRLDARARNQEYKDPQDVEWDRYQKALREEESKSDQVAEMDDERETRERNIYEADEHIRNWETVRELEICREEQHMKPLKTDTQMTSVNSDNNANIEAREEEFYNEQFDELVSWRQKSIKK